MERFWHDCKRHLSTEPMAEEEPPIVLQSRSKAAARERSVTALAFISSQLSLVQESAPVLLQVLSAAHKGTQHCLVSKRDD